MTVPITWGDPPELPYPTRPPHPTTHSKLHKNPPKNVHFTPPPSARIDAGGPFTTTSAPLDVIGTAFPAAPAPVGPIDGPPTPLATPVAGEKKTKKKGGVAKLLGCKPVDQPVLPTPPFDHPLAQASTSTGALSLNGGSDEGGTESWHHHASYFPEYEPIHPPVTSVPGLPGVHNHETYFPDYEPIFHSSHPIHAYPGASGALAYALSTPEAEAARHAARVGHSVSIHYPDLPRFAEYQSVGGAPGWQGNKWGVDGWTGYGWQGERLPDGEGLTFGAPMPQGVGVPTAEELKKQKEREKKAQKDGEGGAGEDGEDMAEGDEGRDDGEGGEGAQGGGGGEGGGGGGGGEGGGGKRKKKKKKK
jgi:hypothetical protein